jgi:moderate conductance mechanosensitive channel
LTALAQLGVNVMALLAGAGVAGIAIGFGAQKLVADLVSGFFFLMDDAFRLNEYISTGKIEGYVEKIALQSMHLRQSDGALHCIPYSGVDTITNFSRNWGTVELGFTVPFDTDIDRVRKIFNQIGEEMAENAAYKNALLQPFSFKGLSEVNEVGIVVSGKFMFKPQLRKQTTIRREINSRVHAEFAKAGIHFARRKVSVSVDTQGNVSTGSEAGVISFAEAGASSNIEAKG